MKRFQIETLRTRTRTVYQSLDNPKREKAMIDPKEYYEHGLTLHGHKCPAMPMGLRVGAAAMNALGVERAKAGQLLALVELGDDHCATCFADGVWPVPKIW